jgi:hypothetical protein
MINENLLKRSYRVKSEELNFTMIIVLIIWESLKMGDINFTYSSGQI